MKGQVIGNYRLQGMQRSRAVLGLMTALWVGSTAAGCVGRPPEPGTPGTVKPIAECAIPQSDGTYEAVFGYYSSAPAGNTLSLPVGTQNAFVTGAADRGQPTSFLPGRQSAQFMVPFNGLALTWTLDGSSTTASVALPECTTACVQHLVDTTKPRVTGTLAMAAAALSVDESRVQRDAFRWQDTLPVPESFADGTPRIYYGESFVTGAETAEALDYLRVHHTNTRSSRPS